MVLESTYGWYWAADLLQDLGANVHLAHALGNNWGNRRVKNDERDAQDLAAMLRIGRLAEGWIAPPAIRELRELVRYRFRSVRHRTSCKAQIHGVMAKNGILPGRGRAVGTERVGPARPARAPRGLRPAPRPLRDLIDVYDTGPSLSSTGRSTRQLQRRSRVSGDPDALPGVGKVIAAIFVAEIGDIARFDSAKKLCPWAGLTPKHRESDEGRAPRSHHQAGLAPRPLGGRRGRGNYRAKGTTSSAPTT